MMSFSFLFFSSLGIYLCIGRTSNPSGCIPLCVYSQVSATPSSGCNEYFFDSYVILATTAATGLLGMMGNKGGAAIRFKLMDSTICFVCSHLAAHRENVAGRNADFHKYAFHSSLH